MNFCQIISNLQWQRNAQQLPRKLRADNPRPFWPATLLRRPDSFHPDRPCFGWPEASKPRSDGSPQPWQRRRRQPLCEEGKFRVLRRGIRHPRRDWLLRLWSLASREVWAPSWPRRRSRFWFRLQVLHRGKEEKDLGRAGFQGRHVEVWSGI